MNRKTTKRVTIVKVGEGHNRPLYKIFLDEDEFPYVTTYIPITGKPSLTVIRDKEANVNFLTVTMPVLESIEFKNMTEEEIKEIAVVNDS